MIQDIIASVFLGALAIGVFIAACVLLLIIVATVEGAFPRLKKPLPNWLWWLVLLAWCYLLGAAILDKLK